MYKYILADTDLDYEAAQKLFLAYSSWLKIDLCFQGFEKELKILKQMYGKPSGGIILLLHQNEYIGCAGVRKITDTDCELKRMWIQPEHQKKGLGQQLLEHAIALGKELDYQTMKLDTLKTMQGPIHLYQKNGFIEIPSYYENPNPVIYFEKKL